MDGKSVVFRVLLNSSVLAVTNIVSIIVAYGFYYLLSPANQVAFQGPIAGLLSIAAFCLWSLLAKQLQAPLCLRGWGELIGTYLVAMLCIPMLFVHLHYSAQGYLSSFDNILAVWSLQIPTNLVALILATKIVTKNDQLWRPADANNPDT